MVYGIQSLWVTPVNAPPPPVGFLIHDVARLMRRRFEQRAASLGFTRSQWQVLVHLAKNEGIHQAGLAEILEIEPITLVRLLDKLELRGMIERRPHATDRRVRLLYLTQAALPSLSPLREIGDATRTEALGDLSAADLDRLMQMLSAMKANLIAACNLPCVETEVLRG